jgi:hypothetical protein
MKPIEYYSIAMILEQVLNLASNPRVASTREEGGGKGERRKEGGRPKGRAQDLPEN